MQKTAKNKDYFWDLGLNTIKQLESDQGILASGRTELYGCIFGRDSLITSLKLLRVYRATHMPELLTLVHKILLNLALLQGKNVNIESGEQPGKCIHEFRPSGHEHLTKHLAKPWYVYEDQIMRNYDSVDATPLYLICIYRYWQMSGDEMFINQMKESIDTALNWMIQFGDSNRDGFIDYQFSEARQSGGLVTQNWMDSVESVFYESAEDYPVYPLAPVEVQAYAYLAFRLWAKFFATRDSRKSNELHERADNLKYLFNEKYPITDPDGNFTLAFKLDGKGEPFRSVRSNIGHVLWASTRNQGNVDCILDAQHIPFIVDRLMMEDMFEPNAGVRTLSKWSRRFSYNSYHNGSIWPHDNAIIAEGFQIHGFERQASKVYKALLTAIGHFGTAIELFVYEDGKYSEYSSESGQRSCKDQAWSAASILDAVTCGHLELEKITSH